MVEVCSSRMSSRIKNASVISIGNEVLSGRTIDTNAAHIGRELRLVGVPVISSYTVADSLEGIVRALDLAVAEADVVIATGGLGPTDDDLTRQAFGRFLGVELELRDDLLAKIKSLFHGRGMEMPMRNTIQAHIPRGAEVVPNDWGTAPGIVARKDGKLLFALPGVPGEMKPMLETSVLPALRSLAQGQAVATARIKCFGAGESAIAEMLGDAMQRDRNPLVNCTAAAGVITLEVVATAQTSSIAEAMAKSEEQSLRRLLGPLVYGVGEQTLAQVVGERLRRLGQTLAVAESCTGGLLAKLITDIPGASAYFVGGWITYSNEGKTRELGVPAALIAQHGAVSEEVATAMAQGARRQAGTDHAIATTGIAGPDGGTEAKPCGLVYIAIDSASGTRTSRHLFFGDRPRVRLRAAQTALNTLRCILDG